MTIRISVRLTVHQRFRDWVHHLAYPIFKTIFVAVALATLFLLDVVFGCGDGASDVAFLFALAFVIRQAVVIDVVVGTDRQLSVSIDEQWCAAAAQTLLIAATDGAHFESRRHAHAQERSAAVVVEIVAVVDTQSELVGYL